MIRVVIVGCSVDNNGSIMYSGCWVVEVVLGGVYLSVRLISWSCGLCDIMLCCVWS